MPIPKHLRLVFRGIFRQTPETWSFGVHGQSVVDTHPDATTGDVNLQTLVDAWVTLAASAKIPDMAQLTDVRAYQVGTDGRAVGPIGILDVTSQVLVGPVGAKYPTQIALVVSTVGSTRGAARLGRFYLPTAATMQTTDGKISSADATTIATAAGEFLKDCSNAIDLPAVLSSASMLNVSTRGGPDGTAQPIDHVEVGHVLDTLRSRRRALVEARVVGSHIDW
jgi:hypothetical protein